MGRPDSPGRRGYSRLVCSALFAAILLSAGCSAGEDGAGAEHEQAAVDAYVASINNRDGGALEKLAPPRNDAKEEVASLLAQEGGQSLTVGSVRFTRDFGPDHAVAHVVGKRGDGADFDKRLTLTKIDGRWYVALGESRGADKPSASTARPSE